MNRELRKKTKLEKVRARIWNNKAGFVSLIALLLANIFLIIGFSVFGISMRELTLSTGGRESMLAFFAADGGMECALYWDIKDDAFATSTPAGNINCAGQNIPVTKTPDGMSGGTSDFSFNFVAGDITSSFASVVVTKAADGGTVIKSRGMNSGDASNPRRVERAWRVSY